MSLDDVLDMTFNQIQLSALCITKVKVEWLNTLVEPIMGALGMDYNPAKADGPSKKTPSKKSKLSDDEKLTAENNKLLGLASMGIPVM